MQVIRGLVAADRSWRATYGWWDPDERSGLRVEKHTVLGWAAQGAEVWPVRVEATTGRGVLVGSRGDPARDALLAVLTAGDSWESIEGMDERVRAILHAGIAEVEKSA